jgi:transcriptional regulator with XRE-family HTH domain
MTLMTRDEIRNRRDNLGELTDQEVFFILRRRAGIPQHRLAKEAGTTQSYLSAWESGRWIPPEKRTYAYWEALDKLLLEQPLSEE